MIRIPFIHSQNFFFIEIEQRSVVITRRSSYHKFSSAITRSLHKMVLSELGGSITRALHKLNNTTVIDEKALTDCLNEINRALIQSDVRFELIRDMQINIKNIVNLQQLAAGHNKRKIIEKVTDYFNIFCLFIINCIFFLCICIVYALWFVAGCIWRTLQNVESWKAIFCSQKRKN